MYCILPAFVILIGIYHTIITFTIIILLGKQRKSYTILHFTRPAFRLEFCMLWDAGGRI